MAIGDTEVLDPKTDVEELNEEELEVKVPEDKEPKEDEEEPEEDDEDDKDKIEAKDDEDKPFPYERPSIQEIKKEFPDFFKKFPIFRDVVFREIEFTKRFATVEDAEEAVQDNIAYHGLRDGVLAGKAEDLVEAIYTSDKDAAERFSLSFLPALQKKDPNLYASTITPLFENTVRQMGRSKDENERNAAIVLAAWLWNEDVARDVVEGKKTFSKSLEESPESKKIKEERAAHETERFNQFQDGVLGEIRTERAKLVLRGLDPDDSMTTSQKEMLVERIINLADKALTSDKSHLSVMDSRWLRAKKDGFNSESKAKIVAAYLARAKQVIPSIRDKERDAFLGTKRKVSQKKVEEIDKKSPEKAVTSGRVSGSNNGKLSTLKPSRELYRKMSDIDILAN